MELRVDVFPSVKELIYILRLNRNDGISLTHAQE
jgi:hypothetical protein